MHRVSGEVTAITRLTHFHCVYFLFIKQSLVDFLKSWAGRFSEDIRKGRWRPVGLLSSLILTLIPKTPWWKSTWQTAVVMNSRAKITRVNHETISQLHPQHEPYNNITLGTRFHHTVHSFSTLPNRSAAGQIHTEQSHHGFEHVQHRAAFSGKPFWTHVLTDRTTPRTYVWHDSIHCCQWLLFPFHLRTPS